MAELHLPDDRLAQAIYTWSVTNVDGTRGMGFGVISPALAGSIDWLQRFPLAAFRLFQEDADETRPELYEARRGFSETGRLFDRGIGVVYCKTADGALDAMNRPQTVVHALIGDADVAGLDLMARIPNDFWTRKVANFEGLKPPLKDYEISVLSGITPLPQHRCPDDHEGSKRILQLIAYGREKQNVLLECPNSERLLAEVLWALPSELIRTASLTPYVSRMGAVRQLRLTVDGISKTGVRAFVPTEASSGCAFRKAVNSAAEEYLYMHAPDIRSFAAAVITATSPAIGDDTVKRTRETQVPRVKRQSLVSREIESIKQASGSGCLSEKGGLAIAERLRIQGVPAARILDETDEVLLEIFKIVVSDEIVRQWFRTLEGVPLSTLVSLWNRTRIAVFLGLILIRLCSTGESLTGVLVASPGVSPEATASILKAMTLYEGGSVSVATAINNGLGSSESMREFICGAFRGHEVFFYDDVLSKVHISPPAYLDFIRFGYFAWVRHRHLSEGEVTALDQVVRPGLRARVRMILGR